MAIYWAQQKLLIYSSQYKKLDMQHLSMMPGHGLFSLYRDLQSSSHVAPGVIFLSMVPLLHKVAVIDDSSGEENY
jgi:hypothetical protein